MLLFHSSSGVMGCDAQKYPYNLLQTNKQLSKLYENNLKAKNVLLFQIAAATSALDTNIPK